MSYIIDTCLISVSCSTMLIPSSQTSVSAVLCSDTDISVIFIHDESDIEYPANFVTADGAFIVTADNYIFNVS